MRQGYWAGMRVGSRTKRCAIAAEKLAPGKELNMHFQANYHFIFIIFNHGGKGKEVYIWVDT